MFITCFEGADGSGKGYQAERMYKRLLEEGKRVHFLDFPRYDTFIGSGIGRRLAGEAEMDAQQLPVEDISLWYAVDRQLAFAEVPKDVDIVLTNRSTYSNIAYQLTRVDVEKQAMLKEWLKTLEFDVLGVPVPSLAFYLDVPLEISMELIKRKGERLYIDGADVYEKDVQMAKMARKIYKQLAEEEANFEHIDCVDAQGNLHTQDYIHEILYRKICERL